MNIRNISLVHVITTIEVGGAEKALLALAKQQVSQFKDVVVVPLKGRPQLLQDFHDCGVRVDLSLLNRKFCVQIFKMRKLYSSEQILFHGHLPRSEVLLWASRKVKHGIVTRHNSEPFFPRAPKFLSSALSRLVLKNVKTVIAISAAVSEFISSNHEVTPNTFVEIVHYGFDPKLKINLKLSNVKNTERREIRLITVSRLAPQKNLSLAIGAALELNKLNYDFKLDIVGEGPMRDELTDLVHKLGLDRNVNFLGKTTEVMQLLCQADIFLLTSNYEGFGLVLLEAMQARIPIVAPRNSSIPEVLGDNHPFIFESGNLRSLVQKLTLLLESGDLVRNVVKAQTERLSSFTIQESERKHREIYRRISIG